jgi:hypothetical protein
MDCADFTLHESRDLFQPGKRHKTRQEAGKQVFGHANQICERQVTPVGSQVAHMTGGRPERRPECLCGIDWNEESAIPLSETVARGGYGMSEYDASQMSPACLSANPLISRW